MLWDTPDRRASGEAQGKLECGETCAEGWGWAEGSWAVCVHASISSERRQRARPQLGTGDQQRDNRTEKRVWGAGEKGALRDTGQQRPWEVTSYGENVKSDHLWDGPSDAHVLLSGHGSCLSYQKHSTFLTLPFSKSFSFHESVL